MIQHEQGGGVHLRQTVDGIFNALGITCPLDTLTLVDPAAQAAAHPINLEPFLSLADPLAFGAGV